MKKYFAILVLVFLIFIIGCAPNSQFTSNNYAYSLAEFTQKQQTFSPYTKYEPSFAIDKARGKIYYVFKVMDDNDIWQIWTATSDLDGNNWKQVQQTSSYENKQRPGIIYDPKDDLLHYFYRTGSEHGAAEKIPRRLITAVKKPNEEKWRNERMLISNDEIDDTISIALDTVRHRLILVYTKDNQITTARINLDDESFKETAHTQNTEMSFIPNMAYDESSDTIYIVFPRARTPRTFDNKDMWLARVNGDGGNYQEMRLTETDYDNTWPFITLDIPRQRFYVYYISFSEPTTYSREGVPNVKERKNLGFANLDGSNWRILRDKNSFSIFGINPNTGVLYGLYQEPYQEMHQGEGNVRYFVVYDPDKNQLEKQPIPSGDRLTYYDAAYRTWDSESNRLFGVQQVCRSAEARAIECQIWTYHGRVLNGKKSALTPQTKAEMALIQPRELPEFKLISAKGFGNKIKINTNRKLSMPVWIEFESEGLKIEWKPEQLSQVDQDKGIELLFVEPLTSYQATYKVCALSDPSEPPKCLEGNILYPPAGQEQSPFQGKTSQNIFESDYFTISVPQGWSTQAQFPGTLATIINVNEVHPEDPNAQRINFKSYITVSFDNVQGRTLNQIVDTIKDDLIKTIPSAALSSSSEKTIDGMPAKSLEITLTQQDINIMVSLIIVMKEDRYFVISLNTPISRWQEYKDLFYQIAKSFKFKY